MSVLISVGCQVPATEQTNPDEQVTALETQLPEQVRKAVGIASAIKTSPGDSEQILGEVEMSERYKQAMVD